MPLFLGYDPGGADCHGVAAAFIDESGCFEAEPELDTLRDVVEVREWLAHQVEGRVHPAVMGPAATGPAGARTAGATTPTTLGTRPAAIGIDTLLAWSPSGGRACDAALRARYRQARASVIAQNSLYSSMTVNGVLVAQAAASLDLPIVECHPKLLLGAAAGRDPAGEAVISRHAEVIARGVADLPPRARRRRKVDAADHAADALVGAWCAARWAMGAWSVDLYAAPGDQLVFPAGEAAYPWPETVW